jgi:hypothetical protein
MMKGDPIKRVNSLRLNFGILQITIAHNLVNFRPTTWKYIFSV